MSEFRENRGLHRLNNGLIVGLRNYDSQTIGLNLKVNCGYAHEQFGKKGLPHFLEHILLNSGTNKYTSRDVRRILKELGEYQGATGLEDTQFGAGFLKKDLEKVLELFSSIIFDSSFDERIVEQERKRILREISDKKSAPDYEDGKKLREAIYPEKDPRINGDAGEIIESTTIEKLKRFHEEFYGASNMELFISGGLPRNIKELVNQYFSNKSSGKNTKFKLAPITSLRKNGIIHTFAPDLYNLDSPEQSNAGINLLLLAKPYGHEDAEAISLLATILGQGGSRLFKKISQEKGLAYSIHAGYDGNINFGRISILASILSKKQDKTIELIFNEFRKLQETPLEKSELNSIKSRYEYNLSKNFETNGGHLYALEKELEFKTSPEEYLAKINSVTPEKIQEVANKYLPKSRAGNYALLIRDPLKDKSDGGTKIK